MQLKFDKKTKFFSTVIVIAAVLAILAACTPNDQSALPLAPVEPSALSPAAVPIQSSSETSEAPTPTPEPPLPFNASINDPVLYGCERAIFSAEITADETDDPLTVGFALMSGTDTVFIDAVLFEETYYAIANILLPETAYDLGVWVLIDGEKTILNETLTFASPARTITYSAVKEMVDEKLKRYTVTDKNRLLLETQACLDIMGMEIDFYGDFGPLTQSNLTRLEYSINSLNGFADFSGIAAAPNEATLHALMDMLSENPALTETDVVHPFVPAPYTLTKYVEFDEDGGYINIEHYLLEEVRKNEEINAIYAEYPFVQDSAEFQTLYADIINGDSSADTKEVKLLGYESRNRASFYYTTRDWMAEIASPKELLVEVAGSNNEITINTMAAYSYLLIDAYRDIGSIFRTSTTYRTCEFQWYLYGEMTNENVARTRNRSWHIERQMYSAVPGFSNHQYGVAIDFYERTTFEKTRLHRYLVEHAEKYGIYNYYREPWHWAYLGVIR